MNDCNGITTKELVEALRCSSTPRHVCKEDCPYRLEMAVRYGMFFPDFEKDGTQYMVECDCDKMCKDAANYIESSETALLKAYENLQSVKEQLVSIKEKINDN